MDWLRNELMDSILFKSDELTMSKIQELKNESKDMKYAVSWLEEYSTLKLNDIAKEQENFDFDSYRINTTTEGFEKRRINQMNDLLTLNIKKEEYDYLQNKYINILSPTYNFEKLLGSRIYSDGFQYNNDLKVLYYYDTISSRPLRFKNPSDKKYKKIKCRRFELDADFFPELNERCPEPLKTHLPSGIINPPLAFI